MFKNIQFFACGIMPSITNSFGAYSCYLALSDLDTVTDLRDAVAAGDVTAAHSRPVHYADIAPTLAKVDAACGGAHLPAMAFFELLAEPIRIVCIWMAFGLLYFGYAHGGPLQMRALEMVRVDAADGDLDASDHKKQARVDKKGAKALRGGEGREHDEVEVRFTHAEEERAHRAAIKAIDPKRESVRHGHMLKYIMFYDILMTIAIMFYFGSKYCAHCKLSNTLFVGVDNPWSLKWLLPGTDDFKTVLLSEEGDYGLSQNFWNSWESCGFRPESQHPPSNTIPFTALADWPFALRASQVRLPELGDRADLPVGARGAGGPGPCSAPPRSPSLHSLHSRPLFRRMSFIVFSLLAPCSRCSPFRSSSLCCRWASTSSLASTPLRTTRRGCWWCASEKRPSRAPPFPALLPPPLLVFRVHA